MFVVKTLKDLKKEGARLITISFFENEVYYHFNKEGKLITISKKGKTVESACSVFPGAELYERELMEKHKVNFKNHPKPEKLFT